MILVHMRQKRGPRSWSVGFSGEVVDLNVRIKLRDKVQVPVMSGNSLMYPSKVDIVQFPFGQNTSSAGFSKSKKSKYLAADVNNPQKVTNCGNFRCNIFRASDKTKTRPSTTSLPPPPNLEERRRIQYRLMRVAGCPRICRAPILHSSL